MRVTGRKRLLRKRTKRAKPASAVTICVWTGPD